MAQRTLGGRDGQILLRGFLIEDANRRQIVFHVLERGEHGLPVIRHLLLVGIARLLRNGVAAARIEKKLDGRCAQRPHLARALNPCAGVAALKAAGTSERNVGVIRGDGDANLGVGRVDLALGRGDIRPALEQL